MSRAARDTAGEAPALPRVSVPGFSLALNVAQVYNLGFAGFCKLETCATREGCGKGGLTPTTSDRKCGTGSLR